MKELADSIPDRTTAITLVDVSWGQYLQREAAYLSRTPSPNSQMDVKLLVVWAWVLKRGSGKDVRNLNAFCLRLEVSRRILTLCRSLRAHRLSKRQHECLA